MTALLLGLSTPLLVLHTIVSMSGILKRSKAKIRLSNYLKRERERESVCVTYVSKEGLTMFGKIKSIVLSPTYYL
ncbi:hypothetical protein CICLE_v10017373mg [Citrus x clementina]|uniref:Uncharacterized protein n=1 Tax=Citrus clementina TaxID=85681 RepID=V4U8R9_CITCL|nr:hypothetical protein CICLE_v10017373mg [Citrus x clementina]